MITEQSNPLDGTPLQQAINFQWVIFTELARPSHQPAQYSEDELSVLQKRVKEICEEAGEPVTLVLAIVGAGMKLYEPAKVQRLLKAAGYVPDRVLSKLRPAVH